MSVKTKFFLFTLIIFNFSLFGNNLGKITSVCSIVKDIDNFLNKELTISGTYIRCCEHYYLYEPSICGEFKIWVEFSKKVNFNLKDRNMLTLKKMIKDSQTISNPKNPGQLIVNYGESKVIFKGFLKNNKIIKYDSNKNLLENIDTLEPKNSYKYKFVVTKIISINYNPQRGI